MSESEKDPHGEPKSPADRTLLGVAPPRLDTVVDSSLRSPVFVRAGDSVADVEPPPLPRMALPSRPPRALDGASEAAFAINESAALRLAREYPVLWMVAAPAFVALCVIGLAVATAPTPKPKPAPVHAKSVAAVAPPVNASKPTREQPPAPALAELEAKAPGTLSASELILMAQGRAEREQLAVRALREKVVQSPALLGDKAIQSQLLQASRELSTAPEAQAALASSNSALGADLLYEVWTGTPLRTDATELARALVYSAQVRPQASPALSAALDLRLAETCEQYKAALPSALKAGDKRSLHPLAKLINRRGCGPKKAQDCFACLRDQADELSATINAVKSRRAPLYPTP
jgi:hypothetical protein